MATSTPATTRLSFRLQLFLAFAFLSLLAGAVAGISIWGLATLRAEARAVAADSRMSHLANDVGLQALLCRRYEKDFFLSSGDAERQQLPVQQWHKASIALREAIKAFEQAATSEADRAHAEAWREAWRLYVQGFSSVEIAISDGRIQTPRDALATFEPFQDDIQRLTDDAVQVAQAKGASAEDTSARLEAGSTRISWLVIVIAAATLALSVASSLLFPAWLIRPITALRAAAARLAGGDLAARVALRRQDELGALGRSFDEMAATIQRNTGELTAQFDAAEAARAAAEAAHGKLAEQLALIESQRAVISEMSVPILPLTSSTLVMPLVGALDSARIEQAQERALDTIQAMSARYLILDITGVPVVDTLVAKGILQIVHATRLLGCKVVLAGIRPEVAQAIVGLGIDLQGVSTQGTLQGGVAYTLRQAELRHN
jgi:rsbT co-antagonist protein RsbR